MMASFTHLDPGTPEATWTADDRRSRVPELRDEIAALIVVAAHPDDETLGAGGLMRRVAARGGSVAVIVATDGEGSHPTSRTLMPAELGALRRSEVVRAVHAVAPGARLHFLGLPDGGLQPNTEALVAALRPLIDQRPLEGGETLVLAPWSGDGHRDHRIAAEAVATVCDARGIRHLGYPIWLWHWGAPDDVPWARASAVRLTADERDAKRRALGEHVTQIAPLSPQPGDEAVLQEGMRAHFERDAEVFFSEQAPDDPTLPTGFFDDFYARHEDPWGFETRWYERRKRGILMSALSAETLGSVLEVGCSTGLLTAELAQRADRVLAIDAAAAAVDAARARLDGDDDVVTFHRGAVPGDWPGGTFDTIVLSEVGYYLSRDDLDRLIELIEASLAREGQLIACHWRHVVPEYPHSGDEVHRALRAHAGWVPLVSHVERDFVLEVFARAPALSVAQAGGLA